MGLTFWRLDLSQDEECTPSFNFLSQILHFTSTGPVPVYFEVQDLPRPNVHSWLHSHTLLATTSCMLSQSTLSGPQWTHRTF